MKFYLFNMRNILKNGLNQRAGHKNERIEMICLFWLPTHYLKLERNVSKTADCWTNRNTEKCKKSIEGDLVLSSWRMSRFFRDFSSGSESEESEEEEIQKPRAAAPTSRYNLNLLHLYILRYLYTFFQLTLLFPVQLKDNFSLDTIHLFCFLHYHSKK